MITISLCMIVKNEEHTLGRCLDCVRDIAEEIIIIDTGSADRTKEIAAMYTDKIYDFPWIDDFSAARNFSFSKASMDYILWLDADDVLLPEDIAKFQQLKASLPPGTDAIMMRYNTGFDEQGRVTFSCYRERLVRRSRGFQWREPVHEYLETGGSILYSDACVTHAKEKARPGGRNLRIYEAILEKGERLSPRGMYYYARELEDNGRYTDAIPAFRRFLDCKLGWVEDNIAACGELARCYQAQQEYDAAFSALLESFRYDAPRPEICCQIGYHFKGLGQYRQALFWFDLATKLPRPAIARGFQQEDYREYIPCLECAVCCDKLEDYEAAEAYNDRAAAQKPDSPAVRHNKAYFESRKTAPR